MDLETEINRLNEAKTLAMANNPDQTLPQVLETTHAMILDAYKKCTAGTSETEDQKLRFNALSRFFSELLYEIMTEEKVSRSEKPFISSQYIDTLCLITDKSSDMENQKFAILSFSAAYPQLFDLVAKTSNSNLWNNMQKLKDIILGKWKSIVTNFSDKTFESDGRNIGHKLAIVKFISQLAIAFSYVGSESGDGGRNGRGSSNSSLSSSSFSLSAIPDTHPVINNKPKLEAEGKSYVDMLLNYLIEEPMMISSIFIGIINCLAFVMKHRQQYAPRILNGLLKFNIDAKYQPDSCSVLNFRLAKRFTERCYKNFVQFGMKNQLIKSSGSGSMNQFHSKLGKISQTLHIIGEETKSKGIMNFDEKKLGKKLQDAERQKILAYRMRSYQKLNGNVNVGQNQVSNGQPTVPPTSTATLSPANVSASLSNNATGWLNPSKDDDKALKFLQDLQNYTMSKNSITGFLNTSPVAINNSYSSIYSLMNSENSRIDLSDVSQDIAVKLATEAILKSDNNKLISGLSIVASRYTDLMSKTTGPSNSMTASNIQSSKRKTSDEEVDHKVENKKQKVADVDSEAEGDEDLSGALVAANGVEEDEDFFGLLGKPDPMDETTKLSTASRIVERIIKTRETPITLDLAVKSSEVSPLNKVKFLNWNNEETWFHILIRLATRGTIQNEKISDMIRERLLNFVLVDFKDKISIMIEWMNEEWYAENALKLGNKEEPGHYMKWSLLLLNELVPFLENQHRKIFIRLMSELPNLGPEHIEKVRAILLDPARSKLGFQTLKFLVMFRPPVKAAIKELLEGILQEDPSLEAQCKGILDKYYK